MLFNPGNLVGGEGAHANARRRHVDTAIKHDRHPSTTTVNGQTVRVKPYSNIKVPAIPVSVQQNAETIPAGCFSVPNIFFDIELVQTNLISYAEHILVQLQLQNSDLTPGNDLILSHFWQLWDKIEIMPDGSTVQDTIYPEMMYLFHNLDVSDEYRAQVGLNYGQNTATSRDPTTLPSTHVNYDAARNGTGITIAPGASYTFFAEIPSILTKSQLYMPALAARQYPRIRFYPSSTNYALSTSLALTPPKILQALFVINGPSYLPSITRRLADIYSRTPAVTSGLVMDRQILDYSPKTGVESSDIVINSLSGKMAGLFIIMRTKGVTREQLFSSGTLANATWKEITQFTFKTAGGSVVGYERQPVQLFRTTYWADHFKSGLNQEKAFLFYPFCQHLMPAIYDGCDVGSYTMTAKESMRFIPVSIPGNTFVDGDSVDLLIYALRYAQLVQGRGNVRLDRLG